VVGIATSRSDALTLAHDLSPDLAFVDIHLADGPTGVDVARHLTGDLGITVLFMTANTKRIPEDFAGACGVIAKPYTERGVREALSYVTAGRDGGSGASQAMSFMPFGAVSPAGRSQVSRYRRVQLSAAPSGGRARHAARSSTRSATPERVRR
jgi:DNA-binding response OmpR family regulator